MTKDFIGGTEILRLRRLSAPLRMTASSCLDGCGGHWDAMAQRMAVPAALSAEKAGSEK